jgi:hypothetical protein
MNKTRKWLLVLAVCATATIGLGASASAGEVKGPPGSVEHPGTPKDMSHANSICAFSGLNDFIHGPTDFHVQSYGIDVAMYGANPREFNPGDACRGGSNPYNP